MANWGAIARGVLGGASATVDAERERMHELLVAEQQRRQNALAEARERRETQQALDDQQERVVREAERAKKVVADEAETARRNQEIPLRVRVARDMIPELKDVSRYDDQTVAAFVKDDNNWKSVLARQMKPESLAEWQKPGWAAAEAYKASLRPASSGTEPSWQTVQTDDGVMQVNPKTGESRPVMSPSGDQMHKPLTGTIQKAIATNAQTMTNVDEALRMLDAHPDAVGLKRMGPDALNQRLDPEGVDARAMIANVGSLILHDRSGAAVTVSEWPRLAPFIPRMGDNAATARRKLQLLRKAMETETAELRSGGRGLSPTASPTTSSAGSQQETPQQRAARLRAKYGVH